MWRLILSTFTFFAIFWRFTNLCQSMLSGAKRNMAVVYRVKVSLFYDAMQYWSLKIGAKITSLLCYAWTYFFSKKKHFQGWSPLPLLEGGCRPQPCSLHQVPLLSLTTCFLLSFSQQVRNGVGGWRPTWSPISRTPWNPQSTLKKEGSRGGKRRGGGEVGDVELSLLAHWPGLIWKVLLSHCFLCAFL